jgi:hypothetical protein
MMNLFSMTVIGLAVAVVLPLGGCVESIMKPNPAIYSTAPSVTGACYNKQDDTAFFVSNGERCTGAAKPMQLKLAAAKLEAEGHDVEWALSNVHPDAYKFHLDKIDSLPSPSRTNTMRTLEELNKQAEQGEAVAQFKLGKIYKNGKGILQNYSEALHWYQLAAKQGSAQALNELGWMYDYGKGVPRDKTTAHMFYNLAASKGMEGAQGKRDALGASMTPAQVNTSQRLAAEWMSANNTTQRTITSKNTVLASQQFSADTALHNIISRFETLASLRSQELITSKEYNTRRNVNIGALLPLTSPPPSIGLERRLPTTQQFAERLRAIKRSVEMRAITVAQHSSERSMILDNILPKTPASVAFHKRTHQGTTQWINKLRTLNLISSAEYSRENIVIHKGVPPSSTTNLKPLGPQPAVHLASFRSRNDAEIGRSQMYRAYKAELSGLESEITEINLGSKGIFYRLKFGPLTDKKNAELLCIRLKKWKQFCEASYINQSRQKIANSPVTKPLDGKSFIYTKDTIPPVLEISSTIQVNTDSPTVRGRVSDKSQVSQVTVNGSAVDLENGTFSFSRYVPSTGTTVSIEAIDEWGNKSTKTVKLTRTITDTSDQITFASLDPTKIDGRDNKNAVALIIGVADYTRAPAAVYADSDASVFGDYARRALGIPRSNIKVLTNDEASLVDLKVSVRRWLRGRIEEGKTDVYVFYAGHGLASSDGEELYLLPYNGEPSLLEETSLQRSELFDVIAAANPKSATVFLDTCYSGLSRGEETLLASARPILITAKHQAAPKGFTVFSAASGLQISSGLDEAKHGLFSYYLMKGMEGPADSNGDRAITAGELHAYVRANVKRQAVRLGREQVPELSGDSERVLVRW